MEREIIMENERVLELYMEEIANLPQITEEDGAILLQKIKAGDQLAKNQFIEGNLKRVIQICGQYIGKGILLDDLIQEGNLILLSLCGENQCDTIQEFYKELEKKIQSTLEELLHIEHEVEKTANTFADQANMVSDTSKQLADELGREPKAEEIATRLSMTEEEVRNIMKLSLDALSVMPQ